MSAFGSNPDISFHQLCVAFDPERHWVAASGCPFSLAAASQNARLWSLRKAWSSRGAHETAGAFGNIWSESKLPMAWVPLGEGVRKNV